jgi:hypothetical protein
MQQVQGDVRGGSGTPTSIARSGTFKTEGNMSEEFPLYPELGEAAEKEAVALIERFKSELQKAARCIAEEVTSDLYVNVMPFIESDSWGNFRNAILDGFKDYNNRKVQAEFDFKTIRQEILREHRQGIIADLNQDLLEEIEGLKRELKVERELRRF